MRRRHQALDMLSDEHYHGSGGRPHNILLQCPCVDFMMSTEAAAEIPLRGYPFDLRI
jgi:hypothetical protein